MPVVGATDVTTVQLPREPAVVEAVESVGCAIDVPEDDTDATTRALAGAVTDAEV
jgi:hypothetical protein